MLLALSPSNLRKGKALGWENILETFATSRTQTTASLNTSSPKVPGRPLASFKSKTPWKSRCLGRGLPSEKHLLGNQMLFHSKQQPTALGTTERAPDQTNILFSPSHANFLNKLFAHFGSKPVFAACDLKSKYHRLNMKALLPAWVSFITHSFPLYSYSVVIFLLCLVDRSTSPNPPEEDGTGGMVRSSRALR